MRSRTARSMVPFPLTNTQLVKIIFGKQNTSSHLRAECRIVGKCSILIRLNGIMQLWGNPLKGVLHVPWVWLRTSSIKEKEKKSSSVRVPEERYKGTKRSEIAFGTIPLHPLVFVLKIKMNALPFHLSPTLPLNTLIYRYWIAKDFLLSRVGSLVAQKITK